MSETETGRAGVVPTDLERGRREAGLRFNLGRHVTLDLYGCDGDALRSAERIETLLKAAANESGATILSCHLHSYLPQGVSGVLIIAESHFTIHTWPEHRFAAVDVFTCGESLDVDAAARALQRDLGAERLVVSGDFARGSRLPVGERAFEAMPVSWKEQFDQGGAWGLASSVDLYGCNPETIRDAQAIRRFAHQACDRIGMRRYGETQVVQCGDDPRVCGYSMIQLIETSLISGHFANDTNTAYIDIFSCRYYEPRTLAEFAFEFFDADHYKLNVAMRE